MDAYTDFASVYDTFMDETPYEEWADFLDGLIQEYGITDLKNCAGAFDTDVEGKTVSGHLKTEQENAGPGYLKTEQEKAEPGCLKTGQENAGPECLKTEQENAASAYVETQKALDSERNLVLDLGCGTGTLTELLYKRGYDMIGVDYSQDMLNIAMEKKAAFGSDILYLCQDMRELDLYSTVGTVISACDSVNYLLENEDVEETFRLVNNYLYPGGVFIFDFNTVYKYEQVIGDTTIAENREACSFIWENYYHEEERINEYDLTIFVKEEKQELFRKFTETHYQRGYTLDEMKAFVEKAGMKFMKAIDADTHGEPTKESERIYIIAKEQEKCNE